MVGVQGCRVSGPGATHLSRVLPRDFNGEHVTDLQPRAWHRAESLLLGFSKLLLVLRLDRFFCNCPIFLKA